jgi:hypothetical protein
MGRSIRVISCRFSSATNITYVVGIVGMSTQCNICVSGVSFRPISREFPEFPIYGSMLGPHLGHGVEELTLGFTNECDTLTKFFCSFWSDRNARNERESKSIDIRKPFI